MWSWCEWLFCCCQKYTHMHQISFISSWQNKNLMPSSISYAECPVKSMRLKSWLLLKEYFLFPITVLKSYQSKFLLFKNKITLQKWYTSLVSGTKLSGWWLDYSDGFPALNLGLPWCCPPSQGRGMSSGNLLNPWWEEVISSWNLSHWFHWQLSATDIVCVVAV